MSGGPSTIAHNNQNKNRIGKKVNFLATGTPTFQPKIKIPARLLTDRLEPPRLAFGLPNFARQKEVKILSAEPKKLYDLFSHVELEIFNPENSVAIAHKIILITTTFPEILYLFCTFLTDEVFIFQRR